MLQAPQWIVWNLFLAIIPVALGYGVAWCIERYSLSGKGGVAWWVWTPLVLAWFAFLPNACYLLTEWRHFLLSPASPIGFMREAAADKDRRLLLTIFTQSWVFFLYTGVGLLAFALSIRPMERLLGKTSVPGAVRLLLGVALFVLTSLGVYLGLIVRLNSWDILRRPLYVLDVAGAVLLVPVRLKAILVFAALLWLLYKFVDIFLDGLALRFKSAPASKSGSKPAAKSAR